MARLGQRAPELHCNWDRKFSTHIVHSAGELITGLDFTLLTDQELPNRIFEQGWPNNHRKLILYPARGNEAVSFQLRAYNCLASTGYILEATTAAGQLVFVGCIYFSLCLNSICFPILSIASKNWVVGQFGATTTKVTFPCIQTTLQCTGYGHGRQATKDKTGQELQGSPSRKGPQRPLGFSYMCFSPELTLSTTAQNTSTRQRKNVCPYLRR